jgi:hypothetical protein
MKIARAVLVSLLIFMSSGCYAEMTGTVVDAETGASIEGAVVLVEWTVTKGMPGMTVTERYKVVETKTDKDGKATISGVLNPQVNPPVVVIYKAGYVAWNNEFIFPDYKKRTDFKWGEDQLFKLERFRKGYSYSKHLLFFRPIVHSAGDSKTLPNMYQAFSWETTMAAREEELLRNKKKLTPTETEDRLWQEIMRELYFQK